MNRRHAERVEGCGSPVETSKHRRCLEAPTEPVGETKSFCPCHRWAMKKILPKKPPILSGVSPFLRSEKNLRFCECENGAFSFVAGCELPEN